MAAKKFKNGVTLLKYVTENIGKLSAEALVADMNESILRMIKTAHRQAESNLAIVPAAMLQEAAKSFGGLAKAPAVTVKSWESKLQIEIEEKVTGVDVKNLILGHCNKVGGCISADNKDAVFVYGFKKADAAEVVSKIGSGKVEGVKITAVK